MAEYEDGWFYGYAPTSQLDADGRNVKVDSRNVIGRFRDHEIVDVEASRKARKRVTRKFPLLETRSLRTAMGGAGSDVSARVIRFDDAYVDASLSEIERFMDAWAAYLKTRKAPISDDEAEVIRERPDLKALYPKAKKPRKTKAKAEDEAPENVVKLASA